MVNITQSDPNTLITPTRHAQILDQTAATVPVQENSPLVQQDQLQTYTVQKGDTLWDISARKLGNPTKWPTIFNLNRNQIQNANLIYPQQILRLPIAQHPPANVTPPVEEVVTPHESVNITPPVEEVVTPHENVNVTPPVEEIILPNKPGQNPATNQQPVQEQFIQPNPGFPNIVPIRGDGSGTGFTPQSTQSYQPNGGAPAPIQPIGGYQSQIQPTGNQNQLTLHVPQNQDSSGMNRAAGVGGLLGSALAAGMIHRSVKSVTHPLSNFGVSRVVGQRVGSQVNKLIPGSYYKVANFVATKPKLAIGAAVVGAGIVGAGLAAGGYKLFSD